MSRSPEQDERLADWVDGNLSPKDCERFEAELRVNPELANAAAEYRAFVELVQHELQFGIDADALGALDSVDQTSGRELTDAGLTDRIMDGLPTATATATAKIHRFPLVASIAAAAAITLFYFGMIYLPRADKPMEISNSAMSDSVDPVMLGIESGKKLEDLDDAIVVAPAGVAESTPDMEPDVSLRAQRSSRINLDPSAGGRRSKGDQPELESDNARSRNDIAKKTVGEAKTGRGQVDILRAQASRDGAKSDGVEKLELLKKFAEQQESAVSATAPGEQREESRQFKRKPGSVQDKSGSDRSQVATRPDVGAKTSRNERKGQVGPITGGVGGGGKTIDPTSSPKTAKELSISDDRLSGARQQRLRSSQPDTSQPDNAKAVDKTKAETATDEFFLGAKTPAIRSLEKTAESKKTESKNGQLAQLMGERGGVDAQSEMAQLQSMLKRVTELPAPSGPTSGSSAEGRGRNRFAFVTPIAGAAAGKPYLVIDLPYPSDSRPRADEGTDAKPRTQTAKDRPESVTRSLSWPAFAHAFARQPILIAKTKVARDQDSLALRSVPKQDSLGYYGDTAGANKLQLNEKNGAFKQNPDDQVFEVSGDLLQLEQYLRDLTASQTQGVTFRGLMRQNLAAVAQPQDVGRVRSKQVDRATPAEKGSKLDRKFIPPGTKTRPAPMTLRLLIRRAKVTRR